MKIDTDKITHIIAALDQHIEEASRSTPAPWYNSDDGLVNDHTCIALCECEQLCYKDDAIFIAQARTMSPLACQSLKIAIQGYLELAEIDGDPYTDEDKEYWAKERSSNFAKERLEAISSLWPSP